MSWDFELLRLINVTWAHPALDWLMPAVSAVDAWIPLFAVVVLVLLWRMRWRGFWIVLCVGVTIAVADGLVSRNLKFLAERVRPRSSVEGLLIRDLGHGRPEFMRFFSPPMVKESANQHRTKGGSFPSSHTMNMFAFATAIALFSRRWAVALYLLAALVAYSRLYCAAHWPSDIFPSVGMGILLGLVIPRLLLRIACRLGLGQRFGIAEVRH